MKRISLSLILTLIPLAFLHTACQKLIEVDAPSTSYNAANVYSNDATAIAVLTGIYTKLGATYGGTFATGAKSISLFTGLSGDEFSLSSTVTNMTLIAYYKNELSAASGVISGSEYWSELYNYIFTCNSAIEGLNDATTLSPMVKKQLMGEAKFLRAFFYFYLVNLFGDLPLATSTDYKVNTTLGRTPKDQIYRQIILDLKEAESLLATDYLDGNLQSYATIPERVRPTKSAAAALLSRTYLFTDDYLDAESQASSVINSSSLYRLTDLNNVFLMNSDEAIWQLQPVNYGRNTEDAITLIIPESGPSDNNPVYLSENLLNHFETGDQRKTNWVNNIVIGSDTLYYPYKYKSATQDAPLTEYLMILRLAEQYLIRAEARAHLGNFPGAISDVNIIRSRAGLSNISDTTQTSIFAIISRESQIELFSEWGHRWLNLKRTGKINEVMTTVTPRKGGSWSIDWQLYPIPIDDIQKNSNLTQNPGY